MTDDFPYSSRRAALSDLGELQSVMEQSINRLLDPFLSPEQVKASHEIMGLDSRLVEDGTYFVLQSGIEIIGCGGWSRRETLYGGNHTKGRNDRLLDPETEPARVRAMYTRPDHVRRGVGRKILDLCESDAAHEGFTRFQLMATLSGEPLYRACGYQALENCAAETSSGITVPLILMEKPASAR
ncbi:GNAT family N-acetyltransferase [Emcibacter sp.]|uniref:GNAT family N-acetyltransferase n=1 Tax=Emcibacter sp. TaxID=1979954 RepID=UPI003A90570A